MPTLQDIEDKKGSALTRWGVLSDVKHISRPREQKQCRINPRYGLLSWLTNSVTERLAMDVISFMHH